MSESMERAHEVMHHEHSAPHTDPLSRRIAVLVAMLEAVLALAEIGGKSSQNQYLAHHITLSNSYAFYQAKNQRAALKEVEIGVLQSLPNQNEAIQNRIKDAQAYAARMRDNPADQDGMKQLAEQAQEEKVLRDEAAHRYHNYEFAVGALEIAIVLASVSVVTSMRALSVGAAVIGAGATVATACIAAGVL